MRYQVMTCELGRGVEQIGEAELPDPLGLRAVGRFLPGPGYARVRDVFLFRKQGKRDAYLDGRDLLQLKLYLDGLRMHSMQIDIDDPDRIEVELAPVEPVEGPAVGSQDELSEALLWDCPQCGSSTSYRNVENALPGSRFAARSWNDCSTCRKTYMVMFPAKSQVARATTPFRATLHEALAQLEAGPIEHWWQADVMAWFQRPIPARAVQLDDLSNESIESARDRIVLAAQTSAISESERERLVAWLRGLEQPDGRFAARDEYERRHPNRELPDAWRRAVPGIDPPSPLGPYSNLADAEHAIASLRLLGAMPSPAAATWIQGRQCDDGAFRSPLSIDEAGEPINDELADTAAAVRALAMISAEPRQKDACIDWLLHRAERMWLTDVVQLYELTSALFGLGALGRLWIDVAKILSEHELEPSFGLYAAVRMVQMLDLERRLS